MTALFSRKSCYYCACLLIFLAIATIQAYDFSRVGKIAKITAKKLSHYATLDSGTTNTPTPLEVVLETGTERFVVHLFPASNNAARNAPLISHSYQEVVHDVSKQTDVSEPWLEIRQTPLTMASLENCLYDGQIPSDSHSMVSINTCHGTIEGMLYTKGQMFSIEHDPAVLSELLQQKAQQRQPRYQHSFVEDSLHAAQRVQSSDVDSSQQERPRQQYVPLHLNGFMPQELTTLGREPHGIVPLAEQMQHVRLINVQEEAKALKEDDESMNHHRPSSSNEAEDVFASQPTCLDDHANRLPLRSMFKQSGVNWQKYAKFQQMLEQLHNRDTDDHTNTNKPSRRGVSGGVDGVTIKDSAPHHILSEDDTASEQTTDPYPSRFVEIVFYHDSSRLQRFNNTAYNMTTQDLMDASREDALILFNHMRTYYKYGGFDHQITLLLRGNVFFSNGDPYMKYYTSRYDHGILVITDNGLLEQFNKYRSYYGHTDQDVGVLLSGNDFQSNIKGVSNIGSICSPRFSGNINSITYRNPVMNSVLLSHELGHVCGANHDSVRSNTIMNPYVTTSTYWSQKSKSSIDFLMAETRCTINNPAMIMDSTQDILRSMPQLAALYDDGDDMEDTSRYHGKHNIYREQTNQNTRFDYIVNVVDASTGDLAFVPVPDIPPYAKGDRQTEDPAAVLDAEEAPPYVTRHTASYHPQNEDLRLDKRSSLAFAHDSIIESISHHGNNMSTSTMLLLGAAVAFLTMCTTFGSIAATVFLLVRFDLISTVTQLFSLKEQKEISPKQPRAFGSALAQQPQPQRGSFQQNNMNTFSEGTPTSGHVGSNGGGSQMKNSDGQDGFVPQTPARAQTPGLARSELQQPSFVTNDPSSWANTPYQHTRSSLTPSSTALENGGGYSPAGIMRRHGHLSPFAPPTPYGGRHEGTFTPILSASATPPLEKLDLEPGPQLASPNE